LRGTKQNLEIKKEKAKRRSESMFFVIGLPSCFVLPCFATGCRTFDFKIATAALRPRNDTKIGMFLFGKRTFFIFCGYFLRGVAPHLVFQTFRSGNCSVFSQNLPNLSLRGGRNFCARRGNL